MFSRTATLTVLALLAFAGNSVLARVALAQSGTGAAAFTAVRLLAGAIVLAAIVALGQTGRPGSSTRARFAPLALFVYAAAFSFAYLSLTTGTGALVLFAAVQLTMLVAAWRQGERLRGGRALGFVIALAGLVYLVSPGLESPPLLGALLMFVAGSAWGCYSLLGRDALDPVGTTARNFGLAATLGLGLWLVAVLTNSGSAGALTSRGLTLAVVSGAVTSGLGYVLWYAALTGLSTTQAASVQLTVPVIAAWGGVLFLAEAVSQRLVIAAGVILGGVAMTLKRAR